MFEIHLIFSFGLFYHDFPFISCDENDSPTEFIVETDDIQFRPWS